LDFFRLNILNESDEDIFEIIKIHKKIIKEEFEIKKSIKNNELISKLRKNGITKGHFLRGI
jgi:hypothetical protein